MKSKRHLVIFSNSIGVDGGAVAYIAHRQCLELLGNYRISVVCGEALTNLDGVSYHVVGVPQYNFLRRGSHVVREFLICQKFKKKAQSLHANQPIDVAIFHSQTGYAIAGSSLQKYGCKTIVVTHGDIFSRPKGTYDRLLTFLYRWATRRGYAFCDRIQALSPFMREQALKHGASKDRVQVIPNGVDMPVRENVQPVPHHGLKLLYVGRISIEKDIPTLLKAMGIVVQSCSDISLTVVGDGTEMARCKRLCFEIGIEKKVIFLGHKNRDSLAEIYQGHDVFCIPSLDDPLPTVVLEAMSFGMPVIGTNEGGIPYLLEKNSGMLVESGEGDRFARAVLQMRSESLRKELSTNAIERVSTDFSWGVVRAKLEKMIEDVLFE